MNGSNESSQEQLQVALIEKICDEFRSAWQSGETPDLNCRLSNVDVSLHEALLHRLLSIDIEFRRARQNTVQSNHYSGLGKVAEMIAAEILASSEFQKSRGASNTDRLEIAETAELSSPNVNNSHDLSLTTDHCLHADTDPVSAIEHTLDHLPATAQSPKTGTEVERDFSDINATLDVDGTGQVNSRIAIHAQTQADTHRNAQNVRYRPVAMHAKGGLGAIYRAKDQELRRIVALKQILPSHRNNADSRTRFLFEAEVTGFLEHPGIVPVYGLGTDHEGQPYYAMRFIQGQSLSAAISRFHADAFAKNLETLPSPAAKKISVEEESNEQKRAGPSTSLSTSHLTRKDYLGREFRSLLQRMIDICNTMHYAHEQGVLHRDLKPDNIMLGAYGETLVVDWGLAKLTNGVGDGQEGSTNSKNSEIGPRDSASKTSHGAIVGTPLFMSPEQAVGSELTAAADIYSLGAILFCIISGDKPIAGQTVGEVMKNVRSGFVKDLAKNCPSAPKPLVSICRKAMAKMPADRYGTALELATDIDLWLSDESVLAHRPTETYGEKLGRFLRKHRGWTTAIAVTLVSITIVSLIATILITQARRNEQIAKLQATQFKDEAVQRYRESRAAIDTWLVQSDEALQFFPGTQSLRERLLTAAAEDYAKLSVVKSDDPELELERGKVLIRLGDLSQMKEDLPSAIKHYKTGITVLRDFFENKQSETKPSSYSVLFKTEAAKAKSRLAIAFFTLGDLDAATQQFTEAIDELQAILTIVESQQAVRYLADAVVNFGELHVSAQRFNEAEKQFLSGLELFERLQDNTLPNDLLNQAKTEELFSRLLAKTGRTHEAILKLDAATARLDRLVTSDAGNPQFLDALASAHISKANILRTRGLENEERSALASAISHYRSLVKALPDLPKYTENLAASLTDIGLLELDLEKANDADLALSEAASMVADVTRRYGDTSYYQLQLGTQYDALGQSRRLLGELDAAQQFLSAADEIFANLSTQFPEQADFVERWAITKSHLAQVLQQEEAEAEFLLATNLLTDLIERFPEVPEYATALGHVYYQHGLKRYSNMQPTAEESFKMAIERWQSLGDRRDPSTTERLAWLLITCPVTELRDLATAKVLAQNAATENGKTQVTWALAEFAIGNVQEAKSLLAGAPSAKSNWTARHYLLASAIEFTLGNITEAAELRQQGLDWMNSNAPNSEELELLLKFVTQLSED